MEQGHRWAVEFYRDERGRGPVGDFIESLEPQMRAKVVRNLDLLQEDGPSLGMPLSRPIKGFRFSELRIQARGNICRLFYFATADRKIVVLHGFVKKTQSTPRNELITAAQRREEYLRTQP